MSYRLEWLSRKLSKWLEVAGGVALVLIMVITGVDVTGIKLLQSPLPGSIDMVMYLQLTAMSFAAASTYVAGRHISVPFLVLRLPKRVQAIIKSAIALLSLSLFSLLAWQACDFGNRLRIVGEYSPTIRIPTFIFAYAIALACLPLCLLLLLEAYESMAVLIRRGRE